MQQNRIEGCHYKDINAAKQCKDLKHDSRTQYLDFLATGYLSVPPCGGCSVFLVEMDTSKQTNTTCCLPVGSMEVCFF